MKEQIKKVYYCDHCNKNGLSKYAMSVHETLCSHNPDNQRPCFNCSCLTKKETTEYFDTPFGDASRSVNSFYCSAKNIFLYTPQNLIKNNILEIENEAMPTECELQNSMNHYDHSI